MVRVVAGEGGKRDAANSTRPAWGVGTRNALRNAKGTAFGRHDTP